MTDKFSKDRSLLDEIMSELRFLADDEQEDILECILNIKEPRSYPRVNKPIEVDILIGDKIIQSHTKDLSASGVFVKSRMNPDIGVPAKIVFSLPGQTRPFKLNGTVARTDSGGIGLYFSDLTPYVREHLEKLLKRVSGFRS
ncbi:PilZ domain-containing protein [uncultured Desulfobacter sp.]|uniref:PilZ domain-containing protein n=1 Tax=uncultured Desulfobacter sp. TaxID=240139 RepID=UPI0029C6072E|nr:PilZ domain-containing protein [uncultured Desulfobacter sp.]